MDHKHTADVRSGYWSEAGDGIVDAYFACIKADEGCKWRASYGVDLAQIAEQVTEDCWYA